MATSRTNKATVEESSNEKPEGKGKKTRKRISLDTNWKQISKSLPKRIRTEIPSAQQQQQNKLVGVEDHSNDEKREIIAIESNTTSMKDLFETYLSSAL